MRHLLLATLVLICVPAVLQAEERGPFSQSCLDDHPAPTDRFLVNLCESFAQEPRVKIEERPCDAVCRYPAEKLREDIEAREAGKKAARKAARRIPSIEELDHEIAMMEAFAMPPRMTMPPRGLSFSDCTSMSFDMFGSLDWLHY